MVNLKLVVDVAPVELEHVQVGGLRQLVRSECIYEHESGELGSVAYSAEHVLVEEEVCSEEEDEAFGVDHLWVSRYVDDSGVTGFHSFSKIKLLVIILISNQNAFRRINVPNVLETIFK